MKKVMALNEEGQLTYCAVPPEDRGKGRCNHIAHQKEGQSVEDFVETINNDISVEEEKEYDDSPPEDMPQEEIDDTANEIDRIAGEKVTMDNLDEVLGRLSPQQIQEITNIGFNKAPEFSLPISDEEYQKEDEDNNLYFANLPEYGISGKSTAIQQMFDKVGNVPSEDGEVEIESNYKNGLSPSEYFKKHFSARSASIAKTVSVSKPGYIARKLFYALSDVEMKKDCEGSHNGILNCKIPGGICYKCAESDGVTQYEPGTLLGSHISTNLSEPGTQLSMKQFHTGGKGLNQEDEKKKDVFNKTFDAYRSSYIVEEAALADSTEESRNIIYSRLREEYDENGIDMDDFNIKIIAKKLTSYKRDPKVGTRFVKNDEKCDIVSIGSIGNMSNPFKSAELQSSYKHFTKPGKYNIDPDAANEIIF